MVYKRPRTIARITESILYFLETLEARLQLISRTCTGNSNTIQLNFLICDSLEVLAAVAAPWQQWRPFVTHAGIAGPNVTMALAQGRESTFLLSA